ncbi:MAG: tetratricopeptide repeat protein [Bacteroidales bacterium]|nr:tetratricopeptide repeat protein [Bacteroidales bacterium]
MRFTRSIKNTRALLSGLFLLCCLIAHAQPASADARQVRQLFTEGVRKGVLNNFSEAESLFTLALDLDSLYAEAYLYRGLARLELAKYPEALEDFLQADDLDHQLHKQSRYLIGLTKTYLGWYDKALPYLDEAVRINPGYASYFQRGRVLYYLEEYHQALRDFDVSLRLKPKLAEVHLYRGKTFYYLGSAEQAVDDLMIAEQTFRDNAVIQYYLSLIFQESGDEQEAADHLKKAEEMLTSVPLETEILISNGIPLDLADSLKLTVTDAEREVEDTPKLKNLLPGFYDTDLQPYKPRGIGVQLATHTRFRKVQETALDYQYRFGHPVFIEVCEKTGQRLYKIIIGQLNTRDEALILRNNLRNQGFIDSFIVRYP